MDDVSTLEDIYSPESVAYLNSMAITPSGHCLISAQPYLNANLHFYNCEIRGDVIVRSDTGAPLNPDNEDDRADRDAIIRDTRKQCASHPGLLRRD